MGRRFDVLLEPANGEQRTWRTEQRTVRQYSEVESESSTQAGRPDKTVHQLGVAPRERSIRLLRKEVIQPHLPVRLPCYDFTPIADPTFDSSLSCELGHWLRVLPTFVV